MRALRLGLALALMAAPAQAAESETPAPTILHLEQTAERAVPRDRLTLELRAEAAGADPRAVQAEVNRRMEAALATVKPVSGIQASSGNYQTYETTPSGPDGRPKPPAQWHAAQNLTLVSRDFPACLELAGRLQEGGMVIGEMHFDIAPETLRARQQTLTDEALKAVTARARQIAATLGLAIVQVRTLTVGNAMQPGGQRPFVMAREVAGAAPSPPAALAGDWRSRFR